MKTTLRIGLAVAAALVALTASPTSAAAQSIDYARQMQLANEARAYWWRSLSPREQYLIRAIAEVERQHQERTGESYIPVTQQNVWAVVRIIGAAQGEAGFVHNRLVTLARNGQVLESVDRSLEWMQHTPSWWMPQSMR